MRKCNLVLLVMPCMLSLMLPAQAGDWHYTPLQLNGLNADLVAGPGESMTDAMDHDGWCFYADNRQARGGLPQELHGMFSDIPYVLENFDGACALQLCSPVKDAQKGTSYGSVLTITFPPHTSPHLLDPGYSRQRSRHDEDNHPLCRQYHQCHNHSRSERLAGIQL